MFSIYVSNVFLVFTVIEEEMKVIAAYLLAVLGGNASPSAKDLKNILGCGKKVNSFFVFLVCLNLTDVFDKMV